MPKYYCDYCDTHLTHDSPSVRKTHCQGRKHKENVRDFYQKWMEDQAQKLIDRTTAAFRTGKMPNTSFPMPAPHLLNPNMPPPRPGMVPPPWAFTFPPGMPPNPAAMTAMMTLRPPPDCKTTPNREMSDNDELVSVVDDGESMIKYLREKIIGRPAVFSRAGDLPTDDMGTAIQRTNSQNSLNDHLPGSSTSSDTDRTTSQVYACFTSLMDKLITYHDKFEEKKKRMRQLRDTPSGVEKLTGASGRRPIFSSSPIVIPKKPPRSNASSQSSSSYTSVADQISSIGEFSVQFDDVINPTFPTLPSTCQQLEHSAARDRISVKNKRRPPTKQKLSTLRETDDNEVDLFSSKSEDDEIAPPLPPKQRHLRTKSMSFASTTTTKKKLKNNLPISSTTPEEDHSNIATTRVEAKVQQPLIDLSDLDAARARLRLSVRPRDRSADNVLLSTNTTNPNSSTSLSLSTTVPTPNNSMMQRSVSFKRPQEMMEKKLIQRPILKVKKEETAKENEITSSEAMSTSTLDHTLQKEPLDEHTNISKQSRSRSSSQEHIYDNLDVFKRPKTNVEDESSATPVVKTREHSIPSLRLRPVTMHIPDNHDKQSTNEFENVFNQLKKRGSIRRIRPNDEPTPVTLVEEVHIPLSTPPQPELEPIPKPIETIPLPQPLNRRKTVGGVHLPVTNKVAADETKPTPSWIDIAKQKQSKFQSVPDEKSHENECEQHSAADPPVTIRKQVVAVDSRPNRKSMFEQPTTQTNVHALERDSIRALKHGNPNRINNLIQFFDK